MTLRDSPRVGPDNRAFSCAKTRVSPDYRALSSPSRDVDYASRWKKFFSHSIDNRMSIQLSQHREVMLLVTAITEAEPKDEPAQLFVERKKGPPERVRSSGPKFGEKEVTLMAAKKKAAKKPAAKKKAAKKK